jgi:2-iminobutanoate/2-iminopropanoate deaminase
VAEALLRRRSRLSRAGQPDRPQRQQVNPWSWQDRFGFSQGWRVDGAGPVVFVSGQLPVSSEGDLVGEDFETQARQVLGNLRTVLRGAGASMDALVRLTVYMIDIGNLRDFGPIRAEFISAAPPASTALEVRALASPGAMLEVKAIAVL